MRLVFIIATAAIATLIGCATAPTPPQQAAGGVETRTRSASVEHPRAPMPTQRSCCRASLRGPSRSTIVRSAAELVGATTITSEGRHISYDCAGVTRAVFLQHGIDLYDGNGNSGANGVRLIFNHMRQYGTLHQEPVPRPGDLVFFDNTWDFNGDGRLNDPLTHVGIVERVEPDGTVIFISRVADAIERYHMNLRHPHIHKTDGGRILNDYIRRKLPRDPDSMGRLTGELFASYGTRLPS
jgi:NlpC/P60 family